MSLRRHRMFWFFSVLVLVLVSVAAKSQAPRSRLQELLDEARGDDPDASKAGIRELSGIDPGELSDAEIQLLLEAVADSNEAVQNAVLKKLMEVHFSGRKELLEEIYDEPAKIIERVAPRYPMKARQRRIQGRVILSFTVGIDGRADKIRLLRSIPALDDAAIESLRKWKFLPATRNGKPVPFLTEVTITFTL